jgi:hypothetical protein
VVFRSAAERGIPVNVVHILSVYWPRSPMVNSFRASFKKRFNEEPSFSAALSYDAARLTLRAFDAALAEGVSPFKDTQAFRDRIAANLRDDFSDPIDVIPGDHKFQNGEYRSLAFQGLQYNSQGELVPWDQNDQEPEPMSGTGKQNSITMPPIYCIGLLIFCSYIGSTIREFNHQAPETKWSFIVRLFSPISIIVDPAISLIVFACVFLILLLTKRDLLEIGSDTLLIYQTGSVALGALSGFLGLRALYALMSYTNRPRT